MRSGTNIHTSGGPIYVSVHHNENLGRYSRLSIRDHEIAPGHDLDIYINAENTRQFAADLRKAADEIESFYPEPGTIPTEDEIERARRLAGTVRTWDGDDEHRGKPIDPEEWKQLCDEEYAS